MGTSLARVLDRTLTALSVLALGFICFVAFKRGGFVREQIDSWRRERQERRATKEAWQELQERGYRLGNGARIVAVEFSDYQCPFCRAASPMIDSLLQKSDSIAIVYVHFPLGIHKSAEPAARAAVCAQNQGKVQEMHRILFSTSAWEEEGHDWIQEAVLAGIADTAAFRACLADPETYHLVERFKEIGKAVGVTGTPTFVSLKGRWLGVPDTVRFLKSLMN